MHRKAAETNKRHDKVITKYLSAFRSRSMKALKYFVITLSCLLLVSAAFRCIVAQGRASASEQLPSEVELLRRQVEQHKAEIQALQDSLQKESEHRAKQQQ